MIRLKELRQQTGMKQGELAARLHIGQTAVSNYEAGNRDPSVDMICDLCDIFGCSADYLLGRSDSPNSTISTQESDMIQAYNAAPHTVQTAISVLLSPYAHVRERGSAAG